MKVPRTHEQYRKHTNQDIEAKTRYEYGLSNRIIIDFANVRKSIKPSLYGLMFSNHRNGCEHVTGVGNSQICIEFEPDMDIY